MFELPFLIFLLIAHIIGDFYLQPRHWVDDKRERGVRSLYLVHHAIIHLGLTFTVTAGWLLFSGASLMLIWFTLTVGVSHYFIDLAKSHLPERNRYFLIDQFLHVLILVLLWLAVTEQFQNISYIFGYIDWFSISVVVLSFLFVMKPASIFIAMLLKPLIADLNRVSEQVNGACNVDDKSARDWNEGLVNAGKMIGIYERLIVLTLILLQQYAAIGFVVAAKSVFRFGDLRKGKTRAQTEYVIVGTFASLAVVLVIGLMTLYALELG